MLWVRTKRGMLVANLGVYRGVVERTENDQTWSARVEAPDQVYHSAFEYPAMTEAQAWVERKIETLLSSTRGYVLKEYGAEDVIQAIKLFHNGEAASAAKRINFPYAPHLWGDTQCVPQHAGAAARDTSQ